MAFLGIDLGTTFSAVAYLGPDGRPITIPNAEGELTTPSVILFDSEKDVIVGREAKRAAIAEPDRVVFDVKRYMGEQFYPRPILGRKLSPVSLSAMILKRLVQDAQKHVDRVDGAVITVPAYFDEGRRQATADAGRIAGLHVLDIVNEPTAAALAYAMREYVGRGGQASDLAKPGFGMGSRLVVVYDLGGGTFDVTVLKLVGRALTVLATGGDIHLGGRDWDERIANHIARVFKQTHGLDPGIDALGRQQLMQTAEEVKRELSRRKKARFALSHVGRNVSGELSQEEFAKITSDLLFRTESRINRALRDAGVKWDAVSDLLAVGGSTRMPQVIEMLRRVSGKEPNVSLSPDEAVAHGAAIHAATCVLRGGGAILSSNATPRGAKAEGSDDEDDQVEEESRQRFLDRLGQAVKDLLGSIKTTNVNAHTLGMLASDREGKRKVIPMVPRNTPLPTEVVRTCGTVMPNQSRITVQVVEGESEDPKDCIPVGTCQISELPRGLPRGSPVQIKFIYDNSGRLHVEVLHLATGAWGRTTIERENGIDPGKIRLNQQVLARLSIT